MGYRPLPTFGAEVFPGRVGTIDLPTNLLPNQAGGYTPSGAPRRMITGDFGMAAPAPRAPQPLPFDLPPQTRIGLGAITVVPKDADEFYVLVQQDAGTGSELQALIGELLARQRAEAMEARREEIQRERAYALRMEELALARASQPDPTVQLLTNAFMPHTLFAKGQPGEGVWKKSGLAGITDWLFGSSDPHTGQGNEPEDIAAFREHLREARAMSLRNLSVAKHHFAQAMAIYASDPGRYGAYSDEVETARQAVETEEGRQNEANAKSFREQGEYNAAPESPILMGTSSAARDLGMPGLWLAAEGSQGALDAIHTGSTYVEQKKDDAYHAYKDYKQRGEEAVSDIWETLKTVAKVAAVGVPVVLIGMSYARGRGARA